MEIQKSTREQTEKHVKSILEEIKIEGHKKGNVWPH